MPIKMKELPDAERPYEKLEIYGEKFLSNAELLAIIIKTGTKEETAVQLAQKVLSLKTGKVEENVRSMLDVSLSELMQIKGIGRVKALQIKAICELTKRMTRPLKHKIKITSPKQVADLLMEEMRYEKREIVKLLLLNTKNEVKEIIEITQGKENYVALEAKDILQEPIKANVSKMIMVHNHPSGNPKPSEEDIKFTKYLVQAANLLGVKLVDHIIIGDGNYHSILSELKKKET